MEFAIDATGRSLGGVCPEGRTAAARPSMNRSELHDATDERDVQAVRRARAGDDAAFTELVGRWSGPLVNLAFRFCRDRSLAEDLAQEAFVKLHASLDRFDGSGTFRGWLLAVAANVYRSELRRRRVPTIGLDDVTALADERFANAVEPAHAELVRRAVAGLPARYRDVLVLYYFTGRDVRTTAEALGVAGGTVKARLSRGRALVERTLRRAGITGATANGRA